jgi:hypothetical protein
MTNYTKEQIESGTLSAKEILLSWTSGQGATGKEPTKYSHVKTGAINNIPVKLDLMTALAEMFVVKSRPTDKFFEALSKGYLSINHLDEYKEAKPAVKPLVGHYLTAAEYLQSCYALLPALPMPSYEAIAELLQTATMKQDKQFLFSTIQEAIALCTPQSYTTANLTAEQLAKYTDLTVKEEALASASSALGVYLEDIKPINDTTLQGKFYPERGTGALLNQLIAEEKYKILVTTPVPAKLDESFNVIESGYILFSIQVITI